MTLLFITLPAALVIAAGAVAAFMWAARNDQYEDLDTPPQRMLLEDPKASVDKTPVSQGSGTPGAKSVSPPPGQHRRSV